MSEDDSTLATIRQLLEYQGFILRDGGPLDQACQDHVTDFMARHHPAQEQIRAVITADPTWRDLRIQPYPLEVSRPFTGWINPAYLESGLLTSTANPPHHSRDAMVSYACDHAHDSAWLFAEATGLHVTLEPLPWPGGFRSRVTTNGRHRGLVFRALSLPLVPAVITRPGTRWETEASLRRVVEAAAARGLVTLDDVRQDTVAFTDPSTTLTWLLPQPRTRTRARHTAEARQPSPRNVPARITALESQYHRRIPPVYDFLRTPLRRDWRFWRA